jgi:hypothetical protein
MGAAREKWGNSVLASLVLQRDQTKVNGMEEAACGMYSGRKEMGTGFWF